MMLHAGNYSAFSFEEGFDYVQNIQTLVKRETKADLPGELQTGLTTTGI